MSDIVIEGKNLEDIDQSNFQSVGPYTDTNQVKEPWQGRDNVDGNDGDKRFELGTYTENNREFWEIQTVNKKSRKSQFTKKSIKIARSYIRDDNNLVISDESEWSVDTFPYVKDQESNETIPLYFYYDKDLHSTEYNNATVGKINFRIELREDGRDGLGNIDNFLPREPFRPFSFGFDINAFGTEALGEPEGDGAYSVGDYVTVEINMDDTSYFERWTKLNDYGIPASFPNFTKSSNNPMSFNMIKEDFELTANIRPNPIIKIAARANGAVDEAAANVSFWNSTTDSIPTQKLQVEDSMYWARFINTAAGRDSSGTSESDIPDTGTSDLFTGTDRGVIDPFTGEGVFKLVSSDENDYDSDEYYTVYDYTWRSNISAEFIASATGSQFQIPSVTTTTLQSNVIRPMENIKIISLRSDTAYQFENFTYIDNQDEQIISSSLIDKPIGLIGLGVEDDETIPSATTNILEQPNFPNGVMQIYANYNVLLYQIRNYNSWKDQSVQSLSYRLKYGYGELLLGGENNFDSEPQFKQLRLNSEIQVEGNPTAGYQLGEFFWWPGSGATQDFSSEILDTLTETDNGASISINEEQDSSEQFISVQDASHYIGNFFKPLGTYVKITKTDDSHNFSITNPNNTNVIRSKDNSTQIDADMYQLGANLQWSFTPNLNFEQGEVGEMPVIQSIGKWSDEDNAILTETDISNTLGVFDMAYVQDGNSMRLTYNPPNSIDSNLYSKYFEFIMRSTIIPPALLEFLGIFELLFQSNNDSLGTVSLLQDADQIPQTTYIGKYGQQGPESQDGDDIETPTYAHTLGEWIDGDYNPSGLDINIINDDAQVGILTVSKHPTFDGVIEEILGYDYFNNWVTTGRNFALLNNIGSYLNLQITNNNSLSITPEPNNNSSINDDIEEFLSFVNQNRSVPRIPIRINAFFELIRTININRLAPGRWTTNWDQAAYEANPGMANVDTWIDDSRIQSAPTSSDIEDATITVPDQFFNGTRELIIRVGIAPSSGADGPNPLISGASDIGLNIEEISAFQYNLKITGVSNSFIITLDWNGLV